MPLSMSHGPSGSLLLNRAPHLRVSLMLVWNVGLTGTSRSSVVEGATRITFLVKGVWPCREDTAVAAEVPACCDIS